MGNVIVPVGIRHSVVQITVERTVMHPVVRVTVNKELRPISPYAGRCLAVFNLIQKHRQHLSLFRCCLQVQYVSLFPWPIRKGNANAPGGKRHRGAQTTAERTAKHPVGRVTAKKGIVRLTVVEPLSITVMCAG